MSKDAPELHNWHFFSDTQGCHQGISRQRALARLCQAPADARVAAWSDGHSLPSMIQAMTYGTSSFQVGNGSREECILASAISATDAMLARISVPGTCQAVRLLHCESRNEMVETHRGIAEVSTLSTPLPIRINACESEDDLCVSLRLDASDIGLVLTALLRASVD
jgi:hypothetical protein